MVPAEESIMASFLIDRDCRTSRCFETPLAGHDPPTTQPAPILRTVTDVTVHFTTNNRDCRTDQPGYIMPIRLAVATHCFRQPFKRALLRAAEIGAGGVQFAIGDDVRPSALSATGRRELLHQLDQLGLRVSSIRFPLRRALCDLDRLEARLSALRDAMQLAFQLKSGLIALRIGHIPPEPDAADYELLRDVLSDLARHGNHVGCALAITPSGEPADLLGRLLSDITTGPVGIDFDPSVCVASGERPADVLRTLHSRVLHVTVRDAIRTADGSGQEVAVGRGEVQWDELLAVIDEMHYRGWLTIDRTGGNDQPESAAQAVQYIRHIAQEC